MKKSDLESMVQDQKNQITNAELDIMKIRRELDAMAKCLGLVYVPPKTSSLRYERGPCLFVITENAAIKKTSSKKGKKKGE